MSRYDRLAWALEGTDAAELVDALAQLPVAQVNMVLAACKASRRAGVQDEVARRAHRRSGRQRVDDDKVASAAASMTRSLAQRASYTLDTLAALKRHYDDGPKMLALAVAGARSQGYSDTEIARALGVTQQAVGGRYGPRGANPTRNTRSAENAAQPQDQLVKEER